MNLSKKGMSLVEIIVSIALISIVLVFLMGLFINVRKTYLTSRTDSKYEMNVAKVVKAIGDDIENYGLYCMKKIETNSSDTSYILVYNQNRSSNPFDRIKKVLELKENADTKDLYTGKNKKINYISYGYDNRYISNNDNFTAQERVSKVTSEIPDTAIIGKSLGYENSIIVSTKETSENKKLVEIKIPIENDVGTDYSINLTGIAAKDDFECAPEELTPIKSYTLTFDSKGGKPQESTKLIAKGFAYGTLPKPVYSGHKFLGWFTSETGGTQITEDDLVDSEEDITLYAHWATGGTGTDAIQKIKNQVKGGEPNFANPAVTDEGVYAMVDDYGISYYFRGAVENNYVKFGKWNEEVYSGQYSSTDTRKELYKTLTECRSAKYYNFDCKKIISVGDNMYWRIIRVNGDGSVRIRYDGTQINANGSNDIGRFINTRQAYNANYNDAKYVGWMYGPAGTTNSTSKLQAQTNTVSSDIKITVDAWYKTNIEDQGYGNNVADSIFCNDRSTPGIDNTKYSDDTGLGYGTNVTAYGAVSREGASGTINYNSPKPSFVCPEKNDAFTVSDTKSGNGALTYPIGLITADEIVAAGSGKYGTTNQSYYLYNPNSWSWSLSPYHYHSYSRLFGIYNDTSLISFSSESNGAIVPVINLTADYFKTLIGTGTMLDPFRTE